MTSCAYLGDVAPYLPVARRLHDAGHEVTVVAPEGFRSVVEPEPFAFVPYAMDCSPAAMHADPMHTRLMRHPTRNMPRLGRYWMDRAFGDDPDRAVGSLLAAFDGADVVVTHPTMGVVSIPVARHLGARTVVGHLFPMMIETSRWGPPVGSRSPRLPRRVNRAAWWGLRASSGRILRDPLINAARARLGQPPLRGNGGWAWQEADHTVVLASRHYYGPEPDDWPPVTWGGFSVWRGPPGQELDAALDRHVDAGDPPVLVMLGTSAATGAGEQFARIGADLDRRGVRSVLLVGDPANLPAVAGRAGATTFAPVTELLPRCSVAVVSGALGGLAAALHAGVPMVVLPQLFDQVWHGRRVQDLGVGRMVRRPGQVADAVSWILADPQVTQRARDLADRLATEDGPGAMAAAVEALLPG